MIIVLKNADFSQSNIGTLSTWIISRSLGTGATYEGVTSVDKGAAFSATVTIAEGYELGTAGVTITMGGTVLSGVHSISGNVITITIAEVTGNVLIKVPTVNTATGEEEEPDEPDTPVTPDEVDLTITWFGALGGSSTNCIACFGKPGGNKSNQVQLVSGGSNKRSFGVVDVSACVGKSLKLNYNQNKSADYNYAAFMSDWDFDIELPTGTDNKQLTNLNDNIVESWNNCDDSNFVSVTTPATVTKTVPTGTKYLVFSHAQASVDSGFSGSIELV